MKKIMTILGGLFMIIGIVMLVASVIININNKKFFKTAVKTEATIDHIERRREINRATNEHKTEYDVYVSYQTEDGASYEDIKLGYYNSSMKKGQTLTVYYDPQAPTKVRAKEGMKLLIWILGGIGVIFSVLGVVLLIKGVNSGRKAI